MTALLQTFAVLLLLTHTTVGASLPSALPGLHPQNVSSLTHNAIQRGRWDIPDSTDYLDLFIDYDQPIVPSDLKAAIHGFAMIVNQEIFTDGNRPFTRRDVSLWSGCYIQVIPFSKRSPSFMYSDLQQTMIGLLLILSHGAQPFDTVWYFRMENGVALAWGSLTREAPHPNELGVWGLGNVSATA